MATVDKMVKYYDATDFKKALHVSRIVPREANVGADRFQDMHAGETIKPVLVW